MLPVTCYSTVVIQGKAGSDKWSWASHSKSLWARLARKPLSWIHRAPGHFYRGLFMKQDSKVRLRASFVLLVLGCATLVVYTVNFLYNGSDVINRPARVLKEVRSRRRGQGEAWDSTAAAEAASPAEKEPKALYLAATEAVPPTEPQVVRMRPPPAIAVTPTRKHSTDVAACAPRKVLARSIQMDHGLDVPHRPLNWVVPPGSPWPAADCRPSELCAALGTAGGADRQVLLVLADAASGAQLESLVASARTVGVLGQARHCPTPLRHPQRHHHRCLATAVSPPRSPSPPSRCGSCWSRRSMRPPSAGRARWVAAACGACPTRP